MRGDEYTDAIGSSLTLCLPLPERPKGLHKSTTNACAESAMLLWQWTGATLVAWSLATAIQQ
jgi:hypothetical protein